MPPPATCTEIAYARKLPFGNAAPYCRAGSSPYNSFLLNGIASARVQLAGRIETSSATPYLREPTSR